MTANFIKDNLPFAQPIGIKLFDARWTQPVLAAILICGAWGRIAAQPVQRSIEIDSQDSDLETSLSSATVFSPEAVIELVGVEPDAIAAFVDGAIAAASLLPTATGTVEPYYSVEHSFKERSMSKSSKFVSLTLVVATLIVGTSTAWAGPLAKGTNTHVVDDGTVSWTLPAGQCPAAPDGLTGSGERHRVTITKVNADGSTTIIINDVVRGTAWDATGTYKFVYENHSIDQVPAGGGVHQISMEDNFILNGNGSVGHLAVGFNWAWTYTDPNGPFDVLPLVNLVERNTRGEPLLCDPI